MVAIRRDSVKQPTNKQTAIQDVIGQNWLYINLFIKPRMDGNARGAWHANPTKVAYMKDGCLSSSLL